jgi:hypothetical protein
MLAQEADDQLALDQEADDQLALLHDALDQDALDHDALDQDALDQEALDHDALDQDAAFQVGSAAATDAQRVASKLLNPVDGSVATNWFSPAFGFASPSAAIPLAISTTPTPSAPTEL